MQCPKYSYQQYKSILCRGGKRLQVWGFVLPVVIAIPVAIPAAYLHIENWLKNYAVRINNHLGIYLASYENQSGRYS